MGYECGESVGSVCNLCSKRFVYCREKRDAKNTCHGCLVNRHRFKLKAVMVEYKGGGCQLCGYNQCLRSLDFHHLDPSAKDFHFGGKHNLGWERIRSELDKCVCLCRNCHGEVHEALELVEWGRGDQEILKRVGEVAANWVPTEVVPYNRSDWEPYHPKYKDVPDREQIPEWATDFIYFVEAR